MHSGQPLQNAEQWVAFLADKKLPVRVSTLSRLQKKIRQTNTALIELNKLIKADPLLCLHIASLAGSLHAAKDSEVTSIDHAINSIGMNKLERLIQRLPSIRLSAHSVADKMYFRAVANSQHAATQTREWLVQSRGGLFAEESFLAALFYGVGHWALWHSAPLHMSKIQIRIREQGNTPEQAEKAVLGCSIASISKGLVELWHLSSLALTALEQDAPLNPQMRTRLHQRALGDARLDADDLRSLNHLTQQKFFPIKLANWLALNVPYGWQSDPALHTIDIINDYLKGKLATTCATLHKNCALAARQYHVVGTLSPAAELLMLPSPLQGGYKLSAAEQQRIITQQPGTPLTENATPAQSVAAMSAGVTSIEETPVKVTPQQIKKTPAAAPRAVQPAPASSQPIAATAAAEPPQTGNNPAASQQPARMRRIMPAAVLTPELRDEALFREVAVKFLKHPEHYTQASAAVADLLNAIVAGLGLSRACINIIDPQQSSLKVIQARGYDANHPLPNSSHQLAPNSLFLRLHEKSACILLNESNRQRLSKALPASYRRHIGECDALLMSIFVHNKPLAIIYADAAELSGGIQSFHQQKFKYLCTAAGVCLQALSSKKPAGPRT